MNITIKKYENEFNKELVDVWEASVRATHYFLQPEDIGFYKNVVEGIDFTSFNVYCAFDGEGAMAGILGVSDGKLEMLFVKPDYIGKGVGRTLMLFVLDTLKADRVDVNQENTVAVNFYKKFGFDVYERADVDDTGKPYPILRLRRKVSE